MPRRTCRRAALESSPIAATFRDMAGGSGGRVLVALGLVVAHGGCVMDNPAWHASVSDSEGSTTSTATTEPPTTTITTTSGGSESANATTDEPTTTAVLTEPTAAATTDATATTIEPTTTATTDPTTTSTSTTGTESDTDTSGSTGEPPPICGAGATGEATMLARRTVNGVVQGCADLTGRHYKIVGIEGGMIKTYACAADPNLGCTGCNVLDVLHFTLQTPVPEGVLMTAPCVYLAAHDGSQSDPNQPCRYAQMAIWHDGTNAPTTAPPVAILGHTTVAVAPAVATLTGVALKVVAKDEGARCTCADANDCCPENAAEYLLKFIADDEVDLSPGASGIVSFAGQAYTAYNGNSHEPGSCEATQAIDWWLLRE